MKTNVGSFDGAVRFVVGIVVLHFGIRDIGWWGLLGLIPIATTVTNWCPLYALLRVNTLGADENSVGHSSTKPVHVDVHAARRGNRHAHS